MGAEFLATAGSSGGLYYYVEHDVTRTVAGNVESVRARLSDALEQIGYSVLNETPIQAKRRGTTAGASGCSNDILEYSTSLTIGLKSAGTNSTRVTFAYVVRHPYGFLTKGDRNTLTREAEALVALSNAIAFPSTCSSCSAEITAGTRFCRQCGAPAHTLDTPTELALLNLTASANAGYKNAFIGAILLLIALLFPFLLFFGTHDPAKFMKLVMVVWFSSGSLGISALLMFLGGLWRLRKSLNQPLEQERKELHPPAIRRSIDAPDTSELIREPASQHSITDATTDLLPQEVKR